MGFCQPQKGGVKALAEWEARKDRLAAVRREERIIEIQFPLKALAEWEARKDRLAAVTRSVYEAQIASEDD